MHFVSWCETFCCGTTAQPLAQGAWLKASSFPCELHCGLPVAAYFRISYLLHEPWPASASIPAPLAEKGQHAGSCTLCNCCTFAAASCITESGASCLAGPRAGDSCCPGGVAVEQAKLSLNGRCPTVIHIGGGQKLVVSASEQLQHSYQAELYICDEDTRNRGNDLQHMMCVRAPT